MPFSLSSIRKSYKSKDNKASESNAESQSAKRTSFSSASTYYEDQKTVGEEKKTNDKKVMKSMSPSECTVENP
jgi:predicted NAD-dependent protein-ADP-ribosyltransferase YbiA (DUF1768 family)